MISFLVFDNEDFHIESLYQESTPTSLTGPSSAVEGSKYYYLETSAPSVPGDIAKMSLILTLPGKINFLNCRICVDNIIYNFGIKHIIKILSTVKRICKYLFRLRLVC